MCVNPNGKLFIFPPFFLSKINLELPFLRTGKNLQFTPHTVKQPCSDTSHYPTCSEYCQHLYPRTFLSGNCPNANAGSVCSCGILFSLFFSSKMCNGHRIRTSHQSCQPLPHLALRVWNVHLHISSLLEVRLQSRVPRSRLLDRH